MVILHKLFFSCGEVTFDSSTDVEAQSLTQCWMNHKDHVNNPKCCGLGDPKLFEK